MKKIIALCLVFIALSTVLVFKSCSSEETILIYTSTEDYNMELLQKRLNENFPNYKIKVEYMSTSNIATKIIEEGENCECDIVYQLEYGYLDLIIDNNRLTNISGKYNMSIFAEDTLSDNKINYILPSTRCGGGIIINNKVLQDNNIPKPKSYNDLLSSKYKGLLSIIKHRIYVLFITS